jgi:hypothetical protein
VQTRWRRGEESNRPRRGARKKRTTITTTTARGRLHEKNKSRIEVRMDDEDKKKIANEKTKTTKTTTRGKIITIERTTRTMSLIKWWYKLRGQYDVEGRENNE